MYGPITTLQCDNRLVKHIPWSAFKMVESDWLRVVDTRDILVVSHVVFIFATQSNKECQDSNRIQQIFSSEKEPTLWHALPALEELQTAWETKRDNPKYALYKNALADGLGKVGKYYSWLDEKPSTVLVLGKSFIKSNPSHY